MRQLQRVNFIGNCRFSHRNTDDPIVFANTPGASHDHSFVGNRTTNAFSTVDSLARRPYDMPPLGRDGRVLDADALCRRQRGHSHRSDDLLPAQDVAAGARDAAGLQDDRRRRRRRRRRSAGRSRSGIAAQMVGVPASSTPPACPDQRGSLLRLHVTFPACWNGVSLDSPNHQQHVAYQMNGRCPAGYDVAIPQISLIYRYPVTGQHNIELASGGVYSAHADFFNALEPGRARAADAVLPQRAAALRQSPRAIARLKTGLGGMGEEGSLRGAALFPFWS